MWQCAPLKGAWTLLRTQERNVTNRDTEMASSDNHDAVKAVKMKYFNWWLDDSFLQSWENKPRAMHIEGARENAQTTCLHTLFLKTHFEKKKQNRKKQNKRENDVSDTWVVSSSQRKKLLRHQIYIVMRHKIFEYSFTASLLELSWWKALLFFSHCSGISSYIEILPCFFFFSK